MILAQAKFFERVRFQGQPVANPESVVVRNGMRFTVLTPRLLRLEWSATGEFEDRSTYVFPTRYAAAPPFAVRAEGAWQVLDTGALVLRYREGSGRFTADNLAIQFELGGERCTWRPGLANPGNLHGTRRTLDNCAGDAALEEGLASRDGWAVFDDSRSVRFGPEDGWVAARPGHDLQDWYFFGHGHDYKGALADYIHFGGQVPLIPRYVLGAWWSRYWAYTDRDLMELVGDFERHDLPLDVLVIDMDWHTPDTWTGYTWNRDLFPDPPAFLRWVHDKGLRVSLNLHPAEGVQPFEEVYPRFAQAMGLDPDSGETIPFRIADKRFARHYFELLHHPLEDDGVDFWWVDWQQGEASELEGLDPLLWLNHLHFADSARRGLRPMLYSRWGGLGNHRYQTGFSGDTYVGWPALQFQPYFTATAANVAYGWWGHDIGGHMGDPTEPELYARWVQFGALSPSLRLHATKDPRAERRPWKYPEEVYRAAKAAFHLRYRLLPYLYTMARIAHDSGLSLCRPMYYDYPEEDSAYAARYQYLFGDQMIVAPIVFPADPETGVASTDVWLPDGDWIDYTTREVHAGPRWVRLLGSLDRLPMLLKAGAILPLAAPFEAPKPPHMASGTTDAITADRLVISVFPGAEGHFRLYEDDGLTSAYQEGQYEWTDITARMGAPGAWTVRIAPVEGLCDALPRERAYEIRLVGSRQPDRVLVDGDDISDWSYDARTLTTTIQVPKRDKAQPVTVVAAARRGLSALGADHNRALVLADVQRLLGDRVPEEEKGTTSLDALLDVALHGQGPGRLDAIARLGGPFVRFVEFSTPEEAGQHLGRAIVAAAKPGHEPYDVEAIWTLFRGREVERHRVTVQGTAESVILDAPFRFDGQVRTMRWNVEVTISWRGQRLAYSHQSQVLFPAVYAWRAIVHDQKAQPLTLDHILDADGGVQAGLEWVAYTQRAEGLISVNQPHGIYLSRLYEAGLKSGAPLAAYLVTTVTSPDEREAVLCFRTAGPTECYTNGQRIEELAIEREDETPHPLRKARRTAPIRLRAGENILLIHSLPPEGKRPWWFFEAEFTAPGGELMTDLAFSCP